MSEWRKKRSQPLTVHFANDSNEQIHKYYENVPIQFADINGLPTEFLTYQTNSFEELSLPKGIDGILGMPWHTQLDVSVKYRQRSINFPLKNIHTNWSVLSKKQTAKLEANPIAHISAESEELPSKETMLRQALAMDGCVELLSCKQMRRVIKRSQKGKELPVYMAYVNKIRSRDEKDALLEEAILKRLDKDVTEEDIEESTPDGYVLPHLKSTGDAKADEMLYKYRDILKLDLGALAKRKNEGLRGEHIDMDIKLKEDAKIPNKAPYRMSPLELQLLQKTLTKYLDLGFIEESISPYGAPVLFAPTKTPGKMRFCIDYRALNEVTIDNSTPLPRIDDCLDQIIGSKIFSTIDLNSGFYQVRVNPKDQEKTAFNCRYGHYEWKVMPMGLKGSPPVFQAFLNKIFRPHLDKFVCVYIDDLIIFSKSPEEHLEHVNTVLKLLRDNALSVNVKKSFFFTKRTKYLGHIISGDGIEMDDEKTKAIDEWPMLKTVREVRQFMGLASYYRRFVPGFASVTGPLTDLTKKDRSIQGRITMGTKELASFAKIKELMTAAPIMLVPDVKKGNFHLHADASRIGLGAVLLQEGEDGKLHPVAYLSRKLSPTEIKAESIYELELIAIIYALEKWRHYLEGQPNTRISTDHKALTWFKTQTKPLSRLAIKFLDFMARFDSKIEYITGSSNITPDALSRRPDYVNSMFTHESEESAHLCHAHANEDSEKLKDYLTISQFETAVFEAYKDDPLYKNRTETEDDNYIKFELPGNKKEFLWYYNPPVDAVAPRICIPNSRNLRRLILTQHHSNEYSGHCGPAKMQELISRTYYWPGLATDSKTFHSSCAVCQKNKHDRNAARRVPAAEWKAPKTPMHTIGIDWIGELPKTKKGNTMAVTIVDRLSKKGRFLPCKTDITAEESAKLFTEYFVRDEGLPTVILSDQGSVFMRKFWKEVWRLMGVTLAISSAYHPQTDGVTERLNAEVKKYLRSFAEVKKDWDDQLWIADIRL